MSHLHQGPAAIGLQIPGCLDNLPTCLVIVQICGVMHAYIGMLRAAQGGKLLMKCLVPTPQYIHVREGQIWIVRQMFPPVHVA